MKRMLKRIMLKRMLMHQL